MEFLEEMVQYRQFRGVSSFPLLGGLPLGLCGAMAPPHGKHPAYVYIPKVPFA